MGQVTVPPLGNPLVGAVYPLGIWLLMLWLASWYWHADVTASLPAVPWELIYLWIVIVSPVQGGWTHSHSWGGDGRWAHMALNMPDKL